MESDSSNSRSKNCFPVKNCKNYPRLPACVYSILRENARFTVKKAVLSHYRSLITYHIMTLSGTKGVVLRRYSAARSYFFGTSVFIVKSSSMPRKEISKKHTKNLEAVGLYLRELRLNENMTRDDVCRYTKIGKHTLLRIENKCHNYGIKQLLLLSDFYNVPASEILSITD